MSPIVLRPLEALDLPAAHALSQVVQWPHRLEDWRLMAGFGQGIAAVDPAGALVGVGGWWPFGDHLATLGLIIVSPAAQKAGIGRRLTRSLVEAAGPRRLQLNATAAGLRLYASLGFSTVGGIDQHQGVLAPDAAPLVPAGLTLRPAEASDRTAILTLDAQASAADRTAMLDALAAVSDVWLAEHGGTIRGYAFCRDFGRGRQIGPVVAETEAIATALLSSVAVRTGGFLRADLPDGARSLAHWLDGAALPRVGHVETMVRGTTRPAPPPVHIFALASQALG